MRPKVYLIPNQICDTPDPVWPFAHAGISALRVFFVEEIKSARRFLKKVNPSIIFDDCVFFLLNEHSSLEETQANFQQAGYADIGIISEAGCPCIADPGADVVLMAHRQGRDIIPLVGPSSIVLALMASGLNGQNFAFNGYLPKDNNERIKKIKTLEQRSFTEKQTQIFMEAPYRNKSMLANLIDHCKADTLLCVAVHLMSSEPLIKTAPIKEWKKENWDIHKKPALFLLQS